MVHWRGPRSLFTRMPAPSPPKENGANNLWFQRVSSALFYGLASFALTVVNKNILTTYSFPSFEFLGLGQIMATLVVLFTAKKLGLVSFPDLDRQTFGKICPLPFLYVGNMLFGLGSTQALSLPMFTALRRVSILMTMVAEVYVLGARPSFGVQFSVYTMLIGSIVAAFNDLGFNLVGYTYVLLNNFFTAIYGVYIKKKLDSNELGIYGLMYYNSFFMFVPWIVFTFYTGDLKKGFEYTRWGDATFSLQFGLSCVMGFVLTYSAALCTQYNSALTVAMVGCLKNVCVTYIGMVIGIDYIFSWMNFVGINISVFGSLLYTYTTFKVVRTTVYSVLNEKEETM